MRVVINNRREEGKKMIVRNWRIISESINRDNVSVLPFGIFLCDISTSTFLGFIIILLFLFVPHTSFPSFHPLVVSSVLFFIITPLFLAIEFFRTAKGYMEGSKKSVTIQWEKESLSLFRFSIIIIIILFWLFWALLFVAFCFIWSSFSCLWWCLAQGWQNK